RPSRLNPAGDRARSAQPRILPRPPQADPQRLRSRHRPPRRPEFRISPTRRRSNTQSGAGSLSWASSWPLPQFLTERTDCLALRREAVELLTGRPAPDDPELHRQRGAAYSKLGLSAKAEAEYQAARAAGSN